VKRGAVQENMSVRAYGLAAAATKQAQGKAGKMKLLSGMPISL